MSRIVVITGGAGGLGKYITHKFANNGDIVIVIGQNSNAFTKLIESTPSNIKGNILFSNANVSSQKDVLNAFNKIISVHGNIDVLINNAGILGPANRFDKCNLNEWIENININLIGSAITIHEAIKYMIPKKKGKIINISGGGAVRPLPSLSAYSASKVGIVRLTETLAIEFEPFNIQINAVAPGFIATGIHDQIISRPNFVNKQLLTETVEKLSKGGDDPNLAADLCLFLADDLNKITGKLLSSVYDDWTHLKSESINNNFLYTLRRVDNYAIFEKNLVEPRLES